MAEQLNIMMIGPMAAGKTSLLAAMYDQFDKVVKNAKLQLVPEPKTSILLQNNLGKLKSMIEGRLDVGEGVGATSERRKYTFGLGKINKNPSMELVFHDYPGEYLTDPTNIQSIYDMAKMSGVIIVLIDTPYLMEENGKYNDLRNRPKQVEDIFKTIFQKLNEPRLVLFVPVKHELYYHQNRMAAVIDRVEQEYSSLLRLLQSPELRENVAVAITPVQTVGGLDFRRFDFMENGDFPEPVFRRSKPNSQFAPMDSEQPLRYILRFLLKVHVNREVNIFYSIFRQLFDLDRPFTEAISEFAKGTKTSEGFKLIQGKDLIDL